MKTLARLLVLGLVLLVAPLRADLSLRHVQQAQQMLGPDVWSRVIRIENETRGGRYPGALHALVFEFARVLWFYAPQEGTQSFSLHWGDLENEKRDFGPLLRAIEPGFTAWREITPGRRKVVGSKRLPNGCWIESVIELRVRLAAGEAVRRPRLLAYYIETGGEVLGHSVLAYERDDQLVIHDPARSSGDILWPAAAGSDPLQLARALEGPQVTRARVWPLEAAVESRAEARAIARHAVSESREKREM